MFTFVDVLEVNSARGITLTNLVPNVRSNHLGHHRSVTLFLMPHYILWIGVLRSPTS